MTEKPKTETTTPASPEPKPEPSSPKRDEWLEALARNPRFVLIKPSGKGFVIGGQSPKAR
jgi:hypothetical protein